MMKNFKPIINIILIILALSLIIGSVTGADYNETSNSVNCNLTSSNNNDNLIVNDNLETINNENPVLSSNDSGDYYVNNSINESGDGSKDHPYKTITEATTKINTLNDSLNTYTVNIAPGTYTENSIVLTKNMTFTNYGIGEVIINGEEKQIFTTLNDSKMYNINFINLSLTNARSGNGSVLSVYENGNVRFINSKAYNNIAGEDGGVIHIGHYIGSVSNRTYLCNGSITCINSSFTNNSALNSRSSSGALSIYKGNIYSYNSIFTNNSAEYGGAICTLYGDITCNDTIFNNNTAEYGGSIFLFNGNLKFTNTTFKDNTAINGGVICINETGNILNINSEYSNNQAINGGSIIIFQNGNISNINTIFTNNFAGSYGGVIYLISGLINNTHCIYNNNTAPVAGAILMDYNSSLINNFTMFSSNIASNGSGGAIYIYNGNNLNDNSYFSENSASRSGGAIRIVYGESITYRSLFNFNNANRCGGAIDVPNIKVSYSKFINNTSPNGSTLCYNYNLSADNNWWGNNNPFNDKNLISKYLNDSLKENVSLNNYLILSFTTNTSMINIKDFASLTLKFQIYDNGSISDLDENISVPLTFYTFNCENGVINPDSGLILNKITSNYTSNLIGNQSINVIVDNQVLTLSINVSGVAGIYGENLIKVFGTNKSYTGILFGSDGKPLSNKKVTLTVIRESNGENKNYTVTTDTMGVFSLAINLIPGYYQIFAVYDNYSCSNYVYVFSQESNKTSTILNSNRFNQAYNAGQNFTGNLYNAETGQGISSQIVSLNLTRLSDGANKIYNVTTDSNGNYQLPINLYSGQYRAYCTYQGTDYYHASGSGTLITVTA